MAGVPGTIRRRSFRARRLLRVGLLLVPVLAVLPATASAAGVTEFVVPTPNSQPAGITLGLDGALWFTEENGHKIGRITTDGAITEYQIPTIPSAPGEITAGPDGNLWFTEFGANPPKVGRLTTAGTFTEWELPLGAAPDGITAGPDGAIWFTHNGGAKIGRITTDGTQLDRVSPPGRLRPGDITPGPDGRLWFTESERQQGWRDQARSDSGDQRVRRAGQRPLRHRCLRRRNVVHDALVWTRSGASSLSGTHGDDFGPDRQGPLGHRASAPTAHCGSPRPMPARSAA